MLVVVGDSVAEGHCAHEPGEMGWVAIIEQQLMARGDQDWRRIKSVLKLALSGKTLGYMLPLFEDAVHGCRESYAGRIDVLAMPGGREAIASIDDKTGEKNLPVTIGAFETSVRGLLRVCTEQRLHLGFVGSYPTAESLYYSRGPWNFYLANEAYQRYQEPVRRLAAEAGVPYIDVYEAYAERARHEPMLAADQVHPNGAGHRLIAEAVAPYLNLGEHRPDARLAIPRMLAEEEL